MARQIDVAHAGARRSQGAGQGAHITNLPAPLHQTADARINYNSSLLGDLTPYAYGKPGYLSSQSAYLNIPHKVQKIVPVVYLPAVRVPVAAAGRAAVAVAVRCARPLRGHAPGPGAHEPGEWPRREAAALRR
jgi:hypothetical protein